MAARAYWSGQIRLSLVTIPVQLFSATRSAATIAFNQIHKPSGKRIRYEKVVPGIGEIDKDDIVKGYQLEKNKYVLLSDEEIEGVKLEAKHTLDLVQFVDQDEIDPIYFEKPYYVAPDNDAVAGEAYVVLREALKETKTIGLGQLVIRGKGSLVALKPSGKGLLIETLRFANELQKPTKYFEDIPGAKPEKELLELAQQLIEKKRAAFEPTKFHDAYQEALKELIDAKAHHRKVETSEEAPKSAKVINLMDALKRSISAKGASKAEAKPAAKRARKPAAKKAPARKKTTAKRKRAA